MYKFKLGKKYTVTTNYKTIVATRVEIVGIVSYEEASKTGYSVEVLATNEKVLSSGNDSYLEENEYYKCKVLGTNDYIIVWGEIIDTDLTNLIEETYGYNCKVTTPASTSTPISAIVFDIERYVSDKYPGTVLDFKLIGGDDNVEMDSMLEKIKKSEAILQQISGLVTIVPALNKIVDGDIHSNIVDMKIGLEEMNSSIATIKSGLLS